ncbi:MAG: LysM domain-containing protein [Anaerolineae bacterium]
MSRRLIKGARRAAPLFFCLALVFGTAACMSIEATPISHPLTPTEYIPDLTAAPIPASNPLSDSAPTDEFCPPPLGWFTYRVMPGDTLAELADQTGSSVSELATANCLNNPRAIPAGMILYLPRGIG